MGRQRWGWCQPGHMAAVGWEGQPGWGWGMWDAAAPGTAGRHLGRGVEPHRGVQCEKVEGPSVLLWHQQAAEQEYPERHHTVK